MKNMQNQTHNDDKIYQKIARVKVAILKNKIKQITI